MDLKKEILREYSKAQVNRIVAYVGRDPERVRALVDIFLEGPYRITQRAAWPLSYCAERNPDLVKPHLKRILNTLEKPTVHVSVRRNVMRLLQFIEIPAKLHGQVANLCYRFLENKKEPVAIRVFSMTVLAGLSGQFPEIRNDLEAIIRQQLPYASAAFVSRARKVLKSIEHG